MLHNANCGMSSMALNTMGGPRTQIGVIFNQPLKAIINVSTNPAGHLNMS